MTFIIGAALFGGTFLLPLFLGRVRDYSAAEVGTTMVVSGLAMFATAPFAGRLVRSLDPRILMFVGFGLCAWGMWDARARHRRLGLLGVRRRSGRARLRRHDRHDRLAAGHHVDPAAAHGQERLGAGEPQRNVGGAFGLAILNTSLTQNTALHMVELTSAIDQTNAGGARPDRRPGPALLGLHRPPASAMKALYGMLQKQATTLAFGDAFALLAVACACAAFVTLLVASR